MSLNERGHNDHHISTQLSSVRITAARNSSSNISNRRNSTLLFSPSSHFPLRAALLLWIRYAAFNLRFEDHKSFTSWRKEERETGNPLSASLHPPVWSVRFSISISIPWARGRARRCKWVISSWDGRRMRGDEKRESSLSNKRGKVPFKIQRKVNLK